MPSTSFTLEKGSAEILGGQLCAWGDAFVGAPDPEAMCCEKFELVAERLPALCERTWNIE